MAKKERAEIPKHVAARVLFLSNRTCCVCRREGKPVQIHHIDENPANNGIINLVVVCFDCHRETQIRGGFDRKLDAEQLTLYRDDWCALVRQRRAKAGQHAPSAAESQLVEPPRKPSKGLSSVEGINIQQPRFRPRRFRPQDM